MKEKTNPWTIFSREFAVMVPEPIAVRDYVMSKYMKPIPMLCDKLQYHYTDIGGFRGIMENKELWATNTKFLNDKNECIQGLYDCKKIIPEVHNKNKDINSDYFKFLEEYIEIAIKGGNRPDIYSISFCRDGDLLSQWRGYGKTGGIAIGFNLTHYRTILDGKEGKEDVIVPYSFLDRGYYEMVESMKKEKDNFKPKDGEWMIHQYKVLYNERIKEKMLEDIITIGIEAIKKQKVERVDERYLKELAQAISQAIEFALPIMKNKGFEEEKEVRYIWRDDGSRKIYFRERNGIIIPYIRCMIRDCNCQEVKKIPIEDIVVGPQVNQQEVIESVKFYLKHKGYEYLVDKVRPSKIPFRE